MATAPEKHRLFDEDMTLPDAKRPKPFTDAGWQKDRVFSDWTRFQCACLHATTNLQKEQLSHFLFARRDDKLWNGLLTKMLSSGECSAYVQDAVNQYSAKYDAAQHISREEAGLKTMVSTYIDCGFDCLGKKDSDEHKQKQRLVDDLFMWPTDVREMVSRLATEEPTDPEQSHVEQKRGRRSSQDGASGTSSSTSNSPLSRPKAAIPDGPTAGKASSEAKEEHHSRNSQTKSHTTAQNIGRSSSAVTQQPLSVRSAEHSTKSNADGRHAPAPQQQIKPPEAVMLSAAEKKALEQAKKSTKIGHAAPSKRSTSTASASAKRNRKSTGKTSPYGADYQARLVQSLPAPAPDEEGYAFRTQREQLELENPNYPILSALNLFSIPHAYKESPLQYMQLLRKRTIEILGPNVMSKKLDKLVEEMETPSTSLNHDKLRERVEMELSCVARDRRGLFPPWLLSRYATLIDERASKVQGWV